MEKMVKRCQVDKKDTWALEDLYQTEEELLQDTKKIELFMDKFSQYKGHVGDGSKTLLEILDLYVEMNQIFGKIYVYVNQKLHEDMGDGKRQTIAGEINILQNKLSTAEAFLEPELLSLSIERIEQFFAEEKQLEHYRRFLEEILRKKSHTLSPELEEVLAKVEDIAQGPSRIFTMFNNADLSFDSIKNEQDDIVPLTQGRYMTYMQSQDRRVRKEAFQSLYKSYMGYKNTLAAAYEANVKQADFYAKMRHYDSALEAALDGGNIPVAVYDNLIQCVYEHREPMYRYMEVRKALLGVETLHMYDIYVPLVGEIQMKISYEQAKEMVIQGLAPLGADYQKLLEKAFCERWIDVYENQGKRTGAYSWGAYGTHPYVLMNYQNNLNSVFTLAHEMGHALHSWHSNHEQDFLYAGYRIFVAEVASTCNEALLIHYLVEHTENQQEKAYLINYFLEQFRTTLYRQTMFAEFEKNTHRVVNEGGSLSAGFLCELYGNLNKSYFGDQVVSDNEIQYEWSRIPHFYRPFYVYQYATGFSAAIAISNKILQGDQKVLNGYFKFLSAGSSKDPIELLKLCDVDMTKKEPIEHALEIFETYVELFANMINQNKSQL